MEVVDQLAGKPGHKLFDNLALDTERTVLQAESAQLLLLLAAQAVVATIVIEVALLVT